MKEETKCPKMNCIYCSNENIWNGSLEDMEETK